MSADNLSKIGTVLQLLKAGEYEKAILIAKKSLLEYPDSYEWHHFLGVSLWQSKQYDSAKKSFSRSLSLNPNAVASLNCLGLLFIDLKLMAKAKQCFEDAIAIAPNTAALHVNLGRALMALGDHSLAVEECNRAITIDPKLTDAYVNMAISYRALSKTDAAFKSIGEALKRTPQNWRAYNTLGNILSDVHAYPKAIASFRNALILRPDHPTTLLNLAGALRKHGDLKASMICYQKSLSIDPKQLEAIIGLGINLDKLGQLGQACEMFRKALTIEPRNSDCWHLYGKALQKDGKRKESMVAYEKALHFDSNHFGAKLNLAALLRLIGEHDKAMLAYEECLRLKPDSPQLHFNLGVMHREYGDGPKAIKELTTAIDLNPHFTEAYRLLSLTNNGNFNDECANHLKRLSVNMDLTDNQRMHAFYGLGRFYRHQKDAKTSFESYENANRLRRKHIDYKIEDDVTFVETLKRCYSQGTALDFTDGHPSESPIIVVGMPRSGTTLTEAILAAHSKVYAGGERQYLEHLTRGIDYPLNIATYSAEMRHNLGKRYIDYFKGEMSTENYFTDKLPGNFMRLGFLFQILPNAKVVFCLRNAMDNCSSIFEQHFSGVQPFAYSLSEIAQFYNLHLSLMNHWKGLFPTKIHTIQYESLIIEQEKTIRSLLSFCGLPFEEACLHHHLHTKRISTASAMQANMPVYSSSINRHLFYGDSLLPLKRELASRLEAQT